jgi:5-methylthioadenosine/S-adenosylhomocysteine deaminase
VLILHSGTVLTMNDAMDVVSGPVVIDEGRVVQVGGDVAWTARAGAQHIDVSGCLVLPGFIQTHVHLCQTLFRGIADDLPLLAWLRQRVWPLEAAHVEASLRASTHLAAAELLRSGTTSVLTMETVHDTEAVLDALVDTGLRATVGKCLMDQGEGAPPRLLEAVGPALEASLDLHRRWHGAAQGRIRIALAPRFAVSCSRPMLEAVAAVSQAHGLLVHTHASEQQEEVALVRRVTGLGNMAYLAATGLATPRLCAAHCVWVDDDEQDVMSERDVKVLHCPGSNLKLGSGVAPVAAFRQRGLTVSIGADGAACNNRLDMFDEMRLTATLQAWRAGPGVVTARDVVTMATRDGARTLGLSERVGQVTPGFAADLIVVDTTQPHVVPTPDPYGALVYACRGSDVRVTIVDGEVLYRDGELTRLDLPTIVATARAEARALYSRAGLAA